MSKVAWLVREVNERLPGLLPDGASLRRDGILTFDARADALGWIGLNRAVYKTGGALEIGPVVGVRHGPLEELVARLQGRRPLPYSPPSTSVQLGYLTPERRYRSWRFEEPADVSSELEDMAAALVEYGWPFIHENADLHSIAERVRQCGPNEERAYRYPCALLLLGRRADALAEVSGHLEALGDRDDEAADAYRLFAQRFHEGHT